MSHINTLQRIYEKMWNPRPTVSKANFHKILRGHLCTQLSVKTTALEGTDASFPLLDNVHYCLNFLLRTWEDSCKRVSSSAGHSWPWKISPSPLQFWSVLSHPTHTFMLDHLQSPNVLWHFWSSHLEPPNSHRPSSLLTEIQFCYGR